MKILKQDDQVIKILDLKTINRLICYTDKGPLTLQIRKGENKYHLILDSVPLSNEDNKALMEVLFPVKEMEIPQVNKEYKIVNPLSKKDWEKMRPLVDDTVTEVIVDKIKKGSYKSLTKGGRPKKVIKK